MKLSKLVVALAFVLLSARAEAYPFLQLDILGGHYDPVSQSIVSNGPVFTLVALLTPQNNTNATQLAAMFADTYYISAAVNPQVAPTSPHLGSFTWNGGTPIQVTEGMTYGTPPLEAVFGSDPGDLPSHGIFPTYFSEFEFKFTAAQKTTQYNSQDNPGGLNPTTATSNVSYYALFNVTTALVGSNILHFDLYNSSVKACTTKKCGPADIDIDDKAPFSHDAQSGPPTSSVPEPDSAAFVVVGVAVAALTLRRLA